MPSPRDAKKLSKLVRRNLRLAERADRASAARRALADYLLAPRRTPFARAARQVIVLAGGDLTRQHWHYHHAKETARQAREARVALVRWAAADLTAARPCRPQPERSLDP